MSYSMGVGSEGHNYTYNVSEMWYDCYPEKGIREHYGLSGSEALPVLRKLRQHMEDNRDRLMKMEPANGWGSYSGALKFVNELITTSLAHPDKIWEGD